MAITMVLCSTGAITIFQGIALVMGENIGTTVTANLAALNANTQARRTAMAHLLFNVFGVIWVLIAFFPFVRFVCGIVGMDPTAESQSPTQLSFALATFHTCFNLINTAVLIWFIPQIEKIVCAIIRPRKTEEDDEFRLVYIRGGIMKTPELSVFQAQKEIIVFGERMQRMFGMVRDLYHAEDDQTFEKIYERIAKYEDISDRMENEIGRYLGQVGDAHLSDDTKEKIRAMLRQIGELESVGDSFYNLARILRRRREKKIEFTPEQVEAGQQMVSLVEEAMTRMNAALAGRREDVDLGASIDIEKKINDLRNTLRQKNVTNVDDHVYTYEAGTVFMDLVTECEKTGDYVMNVLEARLGVDHNGLHFKGILIDTATKVVTVDQQEVFFPRSEYALLKLFMEHPGRVFSREALLEFPWTADVDVTERSLDFNIGRIRRKIGPYAEYLLTGPGYGLLVEDKQ